MQDTPVKTLGELYKMRDEWLESEEGAIYPAELDVLHFESAEEKHAWDVFETVWVEMRAGMGTSPLEAVRRYCDFYKITSIYRKQTIYAFVRACIPEAKKKD